MSKTEILIKLRWDFRPRAKWIRRIWSAEAWRKEVCNPSWVFKIVGVSIQSVYLDYMHCKHLGTDKPLIGCHSSGYWSGSLVYIGPGGGVRLGYRFAQNSTPGVEFGLGSPKTQPKLTPPCVLVAFYPKRKQNARGSFFWIFRFSEFSCFLDFRVFRFSDFSFFWIFRFSLVWAWEGPVVYYLSFTIYCLLVCEVP